MTTPPASPGATPVGDRERVFGLLLFDAEESLARGEAEKAMVLASRAVKERPDNFTARSLVERARRELLRGRRREKLEARVVEAKALIERGDYAAAEKIVVSALKLIPDHERALQLFGRIKDRPRASAAETEAERELERLERAQAEKSLEAARTALQGNQVRRALALLRRGLRQAPDHPALLALLRETQEALAALEAERARRRALLSQVREGLELLAQGNTGQSLRVLRAVLLEDPDHARAQAAIQEVRRVVMAAAAPRAVAPPKPGPPEPRPRSPAPPSPASPHAPPLPLRGQRRAGVPAPERDQVADPTRPSVPVEILLPRTLRKATPLTWMFAGAAGILAVIALVSLGGRSRSTPPPEPPSPSASATPAPAGPLQGIDAGLRDAAENTLASYARALETADPVLLEKARPDMSPERRERRLAPFRGALNAATDLRVIDVQVYEGRAEIRLLATDVVVGGREAPRPPLEESLVFERSPSGWVLVAR